MTEGIPLPKLDKAQIRQVADARRSIPIPTVVRAGQIARDLTMKTKEGHHILTDATNHATRIAREAEVGEAITIITFQVACEEFAAAEYVKSQLSQEDYDTLSFAIRSVVDAASVDHLRSRLTRMRLPEEKQPVPVTKQEPIKPIKPKKEKVERKRSTKSDSKASAEEAQAWLDE